ncbi:MAG: hypothetical protein IPK32_26080 [Verrucomicrobiaceae bacterium]|nr:hypothetical protein [Verrucomicrobiaceae bacterium]
MPPPTIRQHARLLILLYIALVATWSWRLTRPVPQGKSEDPALTAALTQTRESITQRLAGLSQRRLMPALFQLIKLPDAETLDLALWMKESTHVRLRLLTVQSGPLQTPSPLNDALLLAELRQPDAPSLDEARLMIAASGNRLDPQVQNEALLALAQRALEGRQSALAVEILLRACESDSATWETVTALANAAHAARRPSAALSVINRWLEKNSFRDADQREKALEIQTDMLLESGKLTEAAKLTLEPLKKLSPEAAVPPAALSRALRAAATLSDRDTAALLPYIQRHLATQPEHSLTLGQLSALPATATAASYRQWLWHAASITDAAGQADEATALFHRVVALGDLRPLARLYALAHQTGSTGEIDQILTALQNRPESPMSASEIAQALIQQGAAEAAQDVLITHLDQQPKDIDADRALITLTAANEPASIAATLWEAFLHRHPADAAALRQLAAAQIATGSHPHAVRTLQRIPTQDLTDADLRHLASLGEYLDDIDLTHQARQLIVSRQPQPSATDLLALATVTQQHSQPAQARMILAEAAARSAESAPVLANWVGNTLRNAQAGTFSTAAEQVRPAIEVQPEAVAAPGN